jgi:hypothetical protein
MYRKYLWPMGALGLILLAATVLIAAPFLLAYQPPGSAWSTATQASFWSGIGLAVVSLASLWAWGGELALALRGGARQRPMAAPPEEGGLRRLPEVAPPAPVSTTASDEALRALAAAVLKDLQDRLGSSSPR